MTDQFPTPLEIKALAEDYGYTERRPEASFTLFFKQTSPSSDPSLPILINVFYTTRGIMTQLPHPTQGYNALWRSSAYDSLESLAMLFENPRAHTGRGYRQAKDAVRGCAKCGFQKRRGEYSASQWRAGPGKAVCAACVAGGASSNDSNDIIHNVSNNQKNNGRENNGGRKENGGNGGKNNNNKNNGGKHNGGRKENIGNDGVPIADKGDGNNGGEDDAEFPRLSAEALKAHDNRIKKSTDPKLNPKKEMERRQFNCPLCPEEGRGKHVFFKRVPAEKPLVKCPRCKKARGGRCERLYPIPKGEEKGYGHYRCPACKATWGSSRGIMSVGQTCHACELAGSPDNFVKPFRIEAFKSGKGGGIAGGGARPAGRRMKRVTREPIPEDDSNAGYGYSNADRQRFNSNGGGAFGGGFGGGGAGRSYDWQPAEDPSAGAEAAPAASRLSRYRSAARHKCEACATGACRRRSLPVSGVHDLHDGDTASTSGSVTTNSEIDKGEFADRDIDFEDWESDDGEERWVTVGKSGKMLRG